MNFALFSNYLAFFLEYPFILIQFQTNLILYKFNKFNNLKFVQKIIFI